MNVRTTMAASLLATAGLVAVAGPAAAVCDAYSGTCTEPPVVLDETVDAPPPGTGSTSGQPPVTSEVRGSVVPSANTPATLPFTGGELVLASALGVAALAGGTALVVAGRRRAGAPTA